MAKADGVATTSLRWCFPARDDHSFTERVKLNSSSASCNVWISFCNSATSLSTSTLPSWATYSTSYVASPNPRPSWNTPLLVSSAVNVATRSEEHTSELQSQSNLVCRLLLEKKKNYSSSRLS